MIFLPFIILIYAGIRLGLNPELAGQIGELRMTIEVKRAATGETETFELIGTPIAEEEESE